MEFKELFEPIINFIKGLQNRDKENSKDEAKKRLQLVLMQDRASVSPDFFEMMKKELIEVIKKYIEIDEEALEVQLTRGFEDGVTGPALFANIPIKNIKPVAKKVEEKKEEVETTEPQAESATNETPKEEKAEEQAKENVAEENNDVEDKKEEVTPKQEETPKIEEEIKQEVTEDNAKEAVEEPKEEVKEEPKTTKKGKSKSKKS